MVRCQVLYNAARPPYILANWGRKRCCKTLYCIYITFTAPQNAPKMWCYQPYDLDVCLTIVVVRNVATRLCLQTTAVYSA